MRFVGCDTPSAFPERRRYTVEGVGGVLHHCVWALFTVLRCAGRSEVIPSLHTRRRMMFAVPPASVSITIRLAHMFAASLSPGHFFTVARETVTRARLSRSILRGSWRRGFFFPHGATAASLHRSNPQDQITDTLSDTSQVTVIIITMRKDSTGSFMEWLNVHTLC